MSETNRKKQHQGPSVWIILFAGAIFATLLVYLLQGTNIALFNSKGLIAHEQRKLILITISVLFTVAIPTYLLLFFIVHKYRESNTKTKYNPNSRQSKLLVVFVWLIPIIGIAFLINVMWPATHRLAPQKLLSADTKPLTIQVISLRWKWVFIYPEQKIATVNFVQFPINKPVTFEMTADETPMSSFWIPNLGGQLYTMTSHVNRLNLMAETPGDYPGSTAEINGSGFAGMKFTARASNETDFNEWVQVVKESRDVLDSATYQNLLKPSENNPTVFYSAYEPNLYDNVIIKYQGQGEHTHTQ